MERQFAYPGTFVFVRRSVVVERSCFEDFRTRFNLQISNSQFWAALSVYGCQLLRKRAGLTPPVACAIMHSLKLEHGDYFLWSHTLRKLPRCRIANPSRPLPIPSEGEIFVSSLSTQHGRVVPLNPPQICLWFPSTISRFSGPCEIERDSQYLILFIQSVGGPAWAQ